MTVSCCRRPPRSRSARQTTTRSGPPPVLYLLHGLSDDDTGWLRRTSIERYASRRSGWPW